MAGSRSTSLAVLAAASTGSWLSLQPGSGPAGGQRLGFWAGRCPQAGRSLPRAGNTLQRAAPASAACSPRSPIPVSHLDICGGLLSRVSLSEPPPSGGSVTYHGAREGLERLASPLFRALQSSQRCPSTDHSLCYLEGWTTSLWAAAQKLCFPRVRPALVLTPALPPGSRILPRGALGQSLRDSGLFPRVPESPGSCLAAHWAPSLLTGNCLPPSPPHPAVTLDCWIVGVKRTCRSKDPSPWPWSKEKAAFVGCPVSWKTIPWLRPALWPQRPASKP